MVRQRHGDPRLHGVLPLRRRLDDAVARIVDDVEIVAGAADQRVGTGVAVEHVVAAVAGKHVGTLAAV